MAFQMIPPRLSSSPPPLDSLPTVTCPEEEDDEEFGNFSTHNTSFDITGLSDKLPPTPDTSPSKFPTVGHVIGKVLPSLVEGVRDDTISQDSGVGSSNHPNEFSPQPPLDDHSFGDFSSSVPDVSKVSVEPRNEAGNLKSEDDDFTNFQAFSSVSNIPPRVKDSECATISSDNGSGEHDHVNNSSQIFSAVPECYEGSGRRSRNSFSMIGTPPPLDYVANSETLDDEFSRFSPNLPTDNDDFGDFKYNEMPDITNGELPFAEKVNCNKSSPVLHKKERFTLQDSVKNKESAPLNIKESVSANVSIIKNITNQMNNIDENSGYSKTETANVINKSVPPDCISIGNEFSTQVSRTLDKNLNMGYETQSTVTTNRKDGISSVFSSENVVEKVKNEVMDAGSVEEHHCIKASCSCDSAESHWKNEIEEQLDISKVSVESWTDYERGDKKNDSGVDANSISNKSACNHEDYEFSEVRTEKGEHDGIQCYKSYTLRDSVVLREHSPSDIEHFDKADSQSESDFGDFSKANDEDDDLDFADLREQVENGTFGTEEAVHLADEVGKFSDTHINSENEDEFGDFNSSAFIDSEFGDFGSANVGDEFGDFAVHEACGSYTNHDLKGEFGDFDDPEGTRDFGNFTKAAGSKERGTGDFSPSWKESNFATPCTSSPVLKKLESLVLKWIPKGKTALSLQEEQSVPPLHQAVESDAFVWRQLENLEASAALTLTWGNTQAHNFFLSSVNVDARNIVSKEALITLFGQKWSSSVPLFAQTLSFSPLTPAKSTEGSVGPAVGFSGCTRESSSAATTTAVTSPKFRREEQTEVSAEDDGTEEQIPPAKFDWTSSGLTNPLETPGIEREFLSEGGDKGCNNRIKSPPTPSPLVQQILGSGMTKGFLSNTPLQSLSPEVRQVVEHLPDLSFMQSKVLMFPIRGEQ
ncbi:aftiphilin isoform X4 [Cherax quadricarinatus]